jgi:hypothetical protein
MSGAGPSFTFSAVADGVASHKLTLTPAQTATLHAGVYQVTGYVTDDDTAGTVTKELVFSGAIEVAANPAAATVGDQRSFARQMVDTLQASLLKLSSGTASSVSVQGKNYTLRSLPELRTELMRWMEIVQREEDSARTNGQASQKNVLIRFNPLT